MCQTPMEVVYAGRRVLVHLRGRYQVKQAEAVRAAGRLRCRNACGYVVLLESSWARKSATDTIRMPRKTPMESRSASPLTMKSARPARAASRIRLSSGSRQAERVSYGVTSSAASATPWTTVRTLSSGQRNFDLRIRRNSCSSGSLTTRTALLRASSSTRPGFLPNTSAETRTFVSHTIRTIRRPSLRFELRPQLVVPDETP